MFWGLVFLVKVPGFGCFMWGKKPLPSLRETLDLWGPFLLSVSVSGVGILETPCLCFSVSFSMWSFYPLLLWRNISTSFLFFFSEGIVPHVAVDLVCTGGSELSFFLHHYFGRTLPTMPLILLFSPLEMHPPVKFHQFFRQVSPRLQGISCAPSTLPFC